MKKLLKIILLLAIVLVLVAAVLFVLSNKNTVRIRTTSGQVVQYQVELAISPEAQQKGLMHREKLAPKTGMLFLFSEDRVAHMWMKNTLIPLDMLFFDHNGRITHIHHNAIPYDETPISSGRRVAGVFEINAGEARKYHITPGAQIDLKKVR